MISPFQNYFQFFKACLCHRVKLVVSILHLKAKGVRGRLQALSCAEVKIKKRPLNVDNPPESSLTFGEKRIMEDIKLINDLRESNKVCIFDVIQIILDFSNCQKYKETL